jgi:hypothetical protein
VGAIGLVVLVGLAIGVEVFRAFSRRALVREWADDHHYTVLECRHRFFGTWVNWLVAYDVRWKHRGVESQGRVLATGFIRRKAWLASSARDRG